MKKYALIVFALIAGCASQAALGPNEFNAAAYEPSCARQCLAIYSGCASGAGLTISRMVTADILTTCQANAKQCFSTCGRR